MGLDSGPADDGDDARVPRTATSTPVRRDDETISRVLINNIQWIHVPVLVNLTAWSPDLDERCREESVTEMYKDLLTTAFLWYHGSDATRKNTQRIAQRESLLDRSC